MSSYFVCILTPVCDPASKSKKQLFMVMANELIDHANFDIIFQRVSQIRIVGKFIVTVCVAEQNGNREEEEKTFGRSRRKGMKLLGGSRR